MHERAVHRPPLESPAPFFGCIPESFSLPVIDRLSRLKEYVGRTAHHRMRAEKDAIRSLHTSWDTVSIARRWSIEGLTTLAPNFESVIDETILLRKVDIYPFEINTDIGAITGMNTSYTEPLAEQAARFQKKKGGIPRLEIETDNVRRLERWAVHIIHDDTVPIGTKVIWCSPPGYPYTEYTSSGNSYIWVYEKYLDADGQPKIRMIQHRCWPSLIQLKRIQQSLQQRSRETGHLPPSQHTQLSPRNTIINALIELPPTVTLDHIHEEIHRHGDPELSQERVCQFAQYREHIFSIFLYPLYDTLFQNEHFFLPEDDLFWHSDAFREVIRRLDTIFSIAHQHLQKVFIEIRSRSYEAPSIDQVQARCQELRLLYESYVRASQGNAHDGDRSTILQAMQLLATPANATASLGQCGAVAALKSPTSLFRQIHSSTGGGMSGMGAGMSISGSLGGKENLRDASETLRQYLHQFQPLDVNARDGSTRRFWIHQDHLEEYRGNIVQKDDGLFYGPCDVCIEQGEDDFVLTDAQYQQLLMRTRAGGVRGKDDESSREFGRDDRSSAQDQEGRALKRRIGIEEWINNDVFAYNTRPSV